MTEHLDPYGTWGVWQLCGFGEAVVDWCRREQPPAGLVDLVGQWWPRLEHRSEWARATLVERANSPDSAPDETDVWGVRAALPGRGSLPVLCLFRQYTIGRPRLLCVAFLLDEED